jgi:C4-dicarboxylate transporter DctM subunit
VSFSAPLLILLAILRTPLFVVIALSAMIGFYSQEVDLSVISIEIYRLAEMPVLLAIPLFTFAGYLLGVGKASTRLVNLTNSLLGWMPGGLAIVTIFACALFTAFTGASGITIVALGGLLYPALKQAGYLDNFNLGLLTSSGSLGLLFAPSLPLILTGWSRSICWATTPYRIKGNDGANNRPRLPELVNRPRLKLSRYPAFFSAG